MRVRLGTVIGMACALALLCAPGAFASVNLSSTFDTNNEGWQTVEGENPPAGATYDTGSHAILFTDSTGPPFPGAFLAPWSGDASDNYGGTLSFKFRSSANWNSSMEAIIGNNNEQDQLCFMGDPPTTSTTTYSFTLDTSDALSATCNGPATEAEIVGVLSGFDVVAILGEEAGDPDNGITTTLDDVSMGGGGDPPPYDVERELSIRHEKVESPFLNPHLAFTGEITSSAEACNTNRNVVVFKKQKGPDKKLGTRTTDGDGVYRLSYPKRRGTYYAKSAAVDLGLAQCLAVTSSNLKIH